MTWSQVEASKARRLLANDTLSPEKRQALLGRLEEYELNPQAQQKPTDAASIDEAFSKLPARPLDGEVKLPTTAAEIEGGKVQKTQEELDDEAFQRRQLRMQTYRDDAPNASKLREFDLPPEFNPPGADLMTKLNPTAWDEPSVERFMADMGQTLSPSEAQLAQLDPESLHAYKVYRDKKWADALKQAQELGVPIVRNAFVPGIWENLQKGDTTGVAGNVKSGIKTADAAVRGAGDALSLGAAGWVDRQLRPEASEEAEENARAHGTANTIGKVAGYLAPQGAGNVIFSGAKAGLSKVLPKAAQGGYLEAAAAGALAAPAAGAIERGFSADPDQHALDPDRMLIESLLGGGFGLGGHALGALPAKGAQVTQRDNPLLETGEQRLGIRLGPLGGVHLPPAARAAEAERLAMPIDSRPGSATEMLVDRLRPKYAEAGLRESEGLKGTLEKQTGDYFASPEGQARVPVDKTVEAARRRFDALMDDEARVMPGQESSADLARRMEEKLESFGGGTMNAKQLDEFISWVDNEANAATKRGAKDPLLDDFMRAAREDRQQFGANEVTDAALGVARDRSPLAMLQESGLENSNYLRDGMRPIDEFSGAYAGKTPEEVRAIAAGQAPTQWGKPFDPVEVHLYPGEQPILNDGRHRMTAAREAGATDIAAKIREYDSELNLLSERPEMVSIRGRGGTEPAATLSDGTNVTGLAAMKAKQETQLSELDRNLVSGGLPREFRGREPGFNGQPGEVRLDPKTEVPQLNSALKNAYKPAASGDQRRAVEGFAKKAGVYDDLRALGATQVGEELRNMGRLFGATTQSGTRYGRIANASLPWLRAMASDGRIPSRVMEFVRNLRAGLNTPGGSFKHGYNSPLPGPWDFAADPFGTTSMQGLALRGGAPSKFRPGIEAAGDKYGNQALGQLGIDSSMQPEQDQADPTLTEEDVLNLARLIESTREAETRP